MTASAADIARVRRMVAEPTSATYTDAIIAAAIERYPAPDALHHRPVDEDGRANAAWAATYDINAATADIWQEKAAALAANFDFQADGARFERSQALKHAMSMATLYRSRRYAGTTRVYAEINEPRRQDWIGNLAEILDD